MRLRLRCRSWSEVANDFNFNFDCREMAALAAAAAAIGLATGLCYYCSDSCCREWTDGHKGSNFQSKALQPLRSC